MHDSRNEAGGSARSIHYQRRWYYALWGSLLLGSLVLYGLWTTPVAAGTGFISAEIRLVGAPEGTRLDYRLVRLKDLGRHDALFAPGDGYSTGKVSVPILRRRWTGKVFETSPCAILIRLTPPGGGGRYAWMNFWGDLETGLLSNKRRIALRVPVGWDTLSTAESDPTKLF